MSKRSAVTLACLIILNETIAGSGYGFNINYRQSVKLPKFNLHASSSSTVLHDNRINHESECDSPRSFKSMRDRLCFGFLQEILLKANMVARKYGKKTLLNLLPFALLLFSTLLIGYLDLEIWLRMPRTSVHLCSGLFVEMTTQIMLDHITEEIYQPFRWTLLPMLLLLVLVGTTQLSAGTSTDHYILVYASALWTYLFWKIKLVIHEICSVLSIWCFDIITPRSKQKER